MRLLHVGHDHEHSGLASGESQPNRGRNQDCDAAAPVPLLRIPGARQSDSPRRFSQASEVSMKPKLLTPHIPSTPAGSSVSLRLAPSGQAFSLSPRSLPSDYEEEMEQVGYDFGLK